MRAGLDAWSSKTREELLLQVISARQMDLNSLRIVIDVWQYTSPYDHLPERVLKEILWITNLAWRAFLRIIFTFDRVMWIESDSRRYWIGYK